MSSGNKLPTAHANDESTKINDQSIRRLSSITERKVYASPITRYELNRKVEEVSNMMQAAGSSRFASSTSQYFKPTTIYY